jgi:hypothetical protein
MRQIYLYLSKCMLRSRNVLEFLDPLRNCTSFVWLTLEFGRACNELTLLIYADRRASSSRSRVVQVLQAGVGSSCHRRTQPELDGELHKALAFHEPCMRRKHTTPLR